MNHKTNSLWLDYHEPLYKFIRRRINNRLDAEDVLSDVFLKIHTKSETIESDEKLRGWIYSLTRNTIIDYYRLRKKTYSLSDSITSIDEKRETNSRLVIADWIRSVLKCTSDKYFQALKLYELDGHSQAIIAEKLGLTLANTKSRIQRSRERIKDMIIQCCEVEMDSRGRIYDYRDGSNGCVNC